MMMILLQLLPFLLQLQFAVATVVSAAALALDTVAALTAAAGVYDNFTIDFTVTFNPHFPRVGKKSTTPAAVAHPPTVVPVDVVAASAAAVASYVAGVAAAARVHVVAAEYDTAAASEASNTSELALC